MDRRIVIVALSLAPLFAGCAPSASPPAAARSPEQHAERYAVLPGLSSSPHAGLQAELALLQQEQMTPLALETQAAALRPSASAAAHAGRQALESAIPAISRPLLSAQLDEVYRGGPLRLSPVQLERAREISRRWADDRARFEQALASCAGGFGLRPADGMLADVRFLDVLHLGCRVEALVAAEALAENRPEEALAPLAVMLGAARILAQEWNVTTRVTAANLRADALHVLDAVANHDHATSETHERLAELLARETRDWPSDSAAWIGDRAAGLIAYELVRDGYYLSLLEPGELQQLRAGGLVDATTKAVMRNLDGDELFYLTAARRIIESCQLPYFQRVQVLSEIRSDLAAREATADYPLVAGRLLLADFEQGQRLIAEDLARCSAWRIALTVGTGGMADEGVVSPITGRPLEIVKLPSQLRVAGIHPDQAELRIRVGLRSRHDGVEGRR